MRSKVHIPQLKGNISSISDNIYVVFVFCLTNVAKKNHQCSNRLFILDDDDNDTERGENYDIIEDESIKVADKGNPLWFQNDGLEDNDG